ncbi:MAG: HTH domain-containing protein [Evtepia gabavorous]
MQVKDRVLEALEGHRGTYFSGEALAKELQVSRNAVWKAIRQLQDQGYPIHAVSNRGYSLAPDSAMLSPRASPPSSPFPACGWRSSPWSPPRIRFYASERRRGPMRDWLWWLLPRPPVGAGGITVSSPPRFRPLPELSSPPRSLRPGCPLSDHLRRRLGGPGH